MSSETITDERFAAMSWHDNHVHGMRFLEGIDGAGELELDIDHILEWPRTPEGFRFRLQPNTLRFQHVFGLRVTLDYATPGAALGPWSIHHIQRQLVDQHQHQTPRWTIELNWPEGHLSFMSTGFLQTGWGAVRESTQQYLAPSERVPI